MPTINNSDIQWLKETQGGWEWQLIWGCGGSPRRRPYLELPGKILTQLRKCDIFEYRVWHIWAYWWWKNNAIFFIYFDLIYFLTCWDRGSERLETKAGGLTSRATLTLNHWISLNTSMTPDQIASYSRTINHTHEWNNYEQGAQISLTNHASHLCKRLLLTWSRNGFKQCFRSNTVVAVVSSISWVTSSCLCGYA